MTLFSYLLTILGVVFWLFRAIATVLYQLEISFFATPLSTNIEIIVLFATLPCIVLVVKRSIVGAACYFGIYAAYFGTALYNAIMEVGVEGLNITNSSNMLCVLLGVVIPMLTFFDILINKNRILGTGKKKEDWFYNNEDYDRKFDERADRNQYKF